MVAFILIHLRCCTYLPTQLLSKELPGIAQIDLSMRSPVFVGFVADPEVLVLCPVVPSLPVLHLNPQHVIT